MGPLGRLKTVRASDDPAGLGADVEWAVNEIERLTAKLSNYEDQLVRIARLLGGDACDVSGNDKSIAGLVKERIAANAAEREG